MVSARSFARVFALLTLTCAVLVPLAHAQDSFSFTLNPIKNSIYPDEVAYFNLSVTNNQNLSDAFTVSTQEFDWVLDTIGQLSDVLPAQPQSIIVELSPTSTVQPGVSLVRVKVRSANTKEFIEDTVPITVLSLVGSNRTYTPSIFLSTTVPDTIDPRQPLTVSIYLRNRNARNYSALQVSLQSDLFTKEYATTLGPITGDDGEKTNQISLLLDPLTPPGNHTLLVSISVDNLTVNSYETSFEVTPYQDVVRDVSKQSSWFTYTTTYTVTNDGNTPQDVVVDHPTSFIPRLFTSSQAAYTATPDGSALEFSATLQPTQSAEFVVVENYRLLALLAVLIVLSVVSYYVFRSPVVVRKEASLRGSSRDGVSEMRIRLHLKNRSARSIHNVHIVDKVTAMADVLKENSLGTLQPSKVVKKKGAGTLVRWDLDTLEAFEERIITYTARTELTLIGDVYLPAVKVKYDQRGRERTTYSNEVNIAREG